MSQALELVVFRDSVKNIINRQPTQGISRVREEIQKSVSGKKEEKNRSELTPVKQSPKRNNSLGRSELVIEQAKQRLQYLQREEELILQRSQEFESSPRFQEKFGRNSKIVKQAVPKEAKQQLKTIP
jgi:hypothetical protein